MKQIKFLFVSIFILIAFNMNAQVLNSSDTSANPLINVPCISTPTVVICEGPLILKEDTIGLFGPYPPPDNPPPQPPPPPVESPDDTVVFWLHGLNGNWGSWESAATWTGDNYYTFDEQLDYSLSSSINNAAQVTKNRMAEINNSQPEQNNGEDYNHESSILIAHSQGGVVSRQIDWDIVNNSEQREFGGLVTFGSPHHGAPIIDNVNKGLVEEYFTKTCDVIVKAEILDFIYNFEIDLPGVYKLFNGILTNIFVGLGTSVAPNFTEFSCHNIAGFGFDLLESSINPPIGNDLSPGSEVIQTLLGHEVEVPSLACHGIEEEPVSFRELYSLTHNINIPKQDSDNPNAGNLESNFFTADYDDGYKIISEALAAKFFGKYNFYKNFKSQEQKFRVFYIYNVFGGHLIVPIPLADLACWMVGGFVGEDGWCYSDAGTNISSLNEVDQLETAFLDAHSWLKDFNAQYKILFGIGSYQVQTFTTNEQQCRCYAWNNPGNDPLLEYEVPCDMVGEADEDILKHLNCYDVSVDVPHDESVYVTEPSDGVVPKSSAEDFPVKDGIYFRPVLMKGSNHQQIRNDKNTGEILPKLFDGRYDAKFYIQAK